MNKYNEILKLVKNFKSKYPSTIAFRRKKHAKVVFNHLDDEECVKYAFCGQKNDNPLDIISSCVVVLTNKRILIGQKRLLWGYWFTSITPDLFNDLKSNGGIIWGKLIVDTIKEKVYITNVSKKGIIEVENEISSFMMDEKRVSEKC